jgi:hypothetical protein
VPLLVQEYMKIDKKAIDKRRMVELVYEEYIDRIAEVNKYPDL